MKKLLLLLALLPIITTAQSFKDLIKKYESHCNETVLDTIRQHGTVTETFEQINGTYYWAVKLDTVWEAPDCPEYKTPVIHFLTSAQIHLDVSSASLTYTGAIYGSEKGDKKQRSISRDYVCECKRREVEPFSEHFWNWIKTLGYENN